MSDDEQGFDDKIESAEDGKGCYDTKQLLWLQSYLARLKEEEYDSNLMNFDKSWIHQLHICIPGL